MNEDEIQLSKEEIDAIKEYAMFYEIDEVNKTRDPQKAWIVARKYGFERIISDKGTAYYKTLRLQFHQGLPMKTETLQRLLILHVYNIQFKDFEFEEGEFLARDLYEKLGEIDDSGLTELLEEEGYLEKNILFNKEFGLYIGEKLREAGF